MRAYALISAICYGAALTVFTPAAGSAQTVYTPGEPSEAHRFLTVRPRRAASSMMTMDDCGAITSCAPRRPATYDPDFDEGDPFADCISGCDIDVIFRSLTGRPAEGWRR